MFKVMIVDDNMTNLIMAKKALEDLYEIIPVSSGKIALEFLQEMPEPPDVVLLDVDMPEINGFYVISQMKNVEKLANIPVVFLTAQEDLTTEIEGYSLGAIDYIRKPFTATLLRKRIDIHVRAVQEQKHNEKVIDQLHKGLSEKIHNIVELEYAIVEMFTSLMGNRSYIISEHCIRVERYMSVFLDALISTHQFKLEETDAEILRFASRIHDIGKICLADRYLADMGDLSIQEKEFNHAHTVLGSEAIKRVIDVVSDNRFLKYAYNMCRYHHERWDGKGYPDKLMTTNIPLEARILSIVNSYDNFRTTNDGSDPLTHTEAINRIRFWSGTHYDPELVDEFINIEKHINGIRFDVR
ncbi:MAG: response regulator [Lachnospiraceae bacterium]|nr:response regulator [Lachnospiraceae bacterium]